MAEKNSLTVWECDQCFQIQPYKSCFHNCPGLYDWEGTQEELDKAFQEHLREFYSEVRRMKADGVEITVMGADGELYQLEDVVVLAVPDVPGQQYRERIIFEEDGTSYHLPFTQTVRECPN